MKEINERDKIKQRTKMLKKNLKTKIRIKPLDL